MEREPTDEPLSLESTGYLLSELRDGNARAREILFERYLTRLQRWARGRLPRGARDLMDTDDLVQQTLTNALVRMDTFEPAHAGGLHGYLRKAVLNQIRDQVRRAGRRPRDDHGVDDVDDPASDSSPLELAVGAETVRRYDRALGALKPNDRAIVVAHVELCFSYEEIAREFGKSSPNAARMAVSRALRRLASKMDSQHAPRAPRFRDV